MRGRRWRSSTGRWRAAHWGCRRRRSARGFRWRATPPGRRCRSWASWRDVLRGDREGVNPQVYRRRCGSARGGGWRCSCARPIRSARRPSSARSCAASTPTCRSTRCARSSRRSTKIMSSSRVLGSLFVSFALLALVLAASGLYAVVLVRRRAAREGVRRPLALGATARDIARMMLAQTGRLVAIGLVLGLAGGRVLAMARDDAALSGVAVGPGDLRRRRARPRRSSRSWRLRLPVRRATSIDPVTALALENSAVEAASQAGVRRLNADVTAGARRRSGAIGFVPELLADAPQLLRVRLLGLLLL